MKIIGRIGLVTGLALALAEMPPRRLQRRAARLAHRRDAYSSLRLGPPDDLEHLRALGDQRTRPVPNRRLAARPVPTSRTAIAATTVALIALAGCGPTSGPDRDHGGSGAGADDRGLTQTTPPGYEPPAELWTDQTAFDWPGASDLLAEQCPSNDAGRLPADVTADAVEAVVCTVEIRPIAGAGEWRFAVARRVIGGLDLLLDEYAVPDDEDAQKGSACPAIMTNPGHVWLDTTAGVVAVRAPVDGCEQPRDPAASAFRALVTDVVAEEQVDQVSTQLSVDTSCPDDWVDVLADFDDPDGGVSSDPPWAVYERGLHACTYDLDGPDADRGRLVAGRILDRADAATVNAELARAVADPTCRRDDHTRFVVLGARSGFVQHTYVALDGCAVQQNASWWRATDELRILLGG